METKNLSTNILFGLLGAFVARVIYNIALKNENPNSIKSYFVLLSALTINFFIPKGLAKYRVVTEALFASLVLDWISANLQLKDKQTNFTKLLLPPAKNNLEVSDLYANDLYANDLYANENLSFLSTIEAETEAEFLEANKQNTLKANALSIL